MRILYTPPRERGPRSPFRTAFRREGTIAERDGVLWVLRAEQLDMWGITKYWERLEGQQE